jgi:hypothetical protein
VALGDHRRVHLSVPGRVAALFPVQNGFWTCYRFQIRVPPRKIRNIVVSVSDPDWIRIQIRSVDLYLDPDPGGQTLPTKIGKNKEISCFELLDVLF